MNKKLLALCFVIYSFNSQAQTYTSSGSILVPDGVGTCIGGTPGVSTIAVPLTGTISSPADVTINLNLTHTGGFSADMTIQLVAPDGSSTYLINRPTATTSCDPTTSGTFDPSNTLSFNSAFITLVPIASPTPSGNYAPTAGAFYPVPTPLSTFLTGKSVNGNWSIRGIDNYNGFGTGSINSWNIVFGATALPLDLLSFTGKNSSNGYNEFEWKTGVEKLTRSFELERSTNGSNYTKVGTVMAVGNGNNTYTHKDIYSTNGNVYYRLKMIDIDGTFGFSNTIRLNINDIGNKLARVFPNPAKGSLELFVENDIDLVGTQAQLSDMTGRTIQVIEIKESNQQLDITNLAPGLYTIRLANGEIIKFKKVD